MKKSFLYGLFSPSRSSLFYVLAMVGMAWFFSPALHAQIFLWSPDNTINGDTYYDNYFEVGGDAFVDGSTEIVGDLSADSSVYIGGTLYAANLEVTNLTFDTVTVGNASVDGSFELFSNFSPGMSSAWGVGGSWLHNSLDLGDLTYTSTDTPAFNISQLSSGGYLHPTTYFTGYDGNTTWVWQENGLAVQASTGSVGVQMTLDNGGNLTVNNPADSNNIILNPEAGSLAVNNAGGALTVSDTGADSITINATAQTLTFYNGTSHESQSISPESVAFTFTATGAGQVYGSGSTASGNNAFAIGNNNTASGAASFAIGNNLTAAFVDSMVLGQWNANITGSSSGNTTWSATDPLFVIGNGQSSGNRSNALVVLKNGDTSINGNLTVSGVTTFDGVVNFTGNVTLPGNTSYTPQGDILMGQFGD